MEKTIVKKDEENLEITETRVTKTTLSKADIEERKATLEKNLTEFNELLDYFN